MNPNIYIDEAYLLEQVRKWRRKREQERLLVVVSRRGSGHAIVRLLIGNLGACLVSLGVNWRHY